MARKFKQLIKDNSGQAMIAALVCLVIGCLTITPVVSYAGTSVRNITLRESSMRVLYAADAGIEDVIWCLQHSTTPHTNLTQNLNGMQVGMNTVLRGDYTLVAGEWVVPGGSHSADLDISSNIEYDSYYSEWKYTITITWNGPGNCWIIGVGARLPMGYDYEPGSAFLFTGNFSGDEPSKTEDGYGAYLLDWSFPKIVMNSPGEQTQTFLIDGEGDLEENYGWGEAERQDVGMVGELTGTFYTITATAMKSGMVTGQIVADVMLKLPNIYIISWKTES